MAPESVEQPGLVAEIDAALSRALPHLRQADGAQLGDWLAVLSAPSVREDGRLLSGYTILLSGNMLEHNALGLLAKGQELLGAEDDDDE